MGLFKKIKKYALPAIGAVLGSTILPGIGYGITALGGGAIGAGLGSAASTYSTTHNFADALKSGILGGGGAYLGGQLAGNVIGSRLGTVGGTIGESAANSVTGSLGGMAGAAGATASNTLMNTGIGSLLGSAYGSEMAQNALGPDMERPMGYYGPAAFRPTRQGEKAAPASVQGLGSLTGEQKTTNLANQGVYGSGNGPEEQSYFMNLMNRRLVDEGGNTSDLNAINPIEQSYLQRLGLSGYGNSRDLLEAMSKWSPA